MREARAQRLLEQHGITLTVLVQEAGRSKATWSRLLSGNLEHHRRAEPRADVEQLLRSRGVTIPPDLWIRHTETTATSDDGAIHMQAQALSQAAQRSFKLFMNPFDPDAIVDRATGRDRLDDLYLPISHSFAKARLVQAYVKAGFVAIAGEPGSGKTTLNKLALREAKEQLGDLVIVQPANIERRKLTAMHIASEIIRQLSTESVPQKANARDALAAEILLHRYEQNQRVALLIDEAHELPDSTVKDLKRYHEMSHGYARLLGIVLIGQSELAGRFAHERNHKLREVIIRCQLIPLGPMAGNTADYIATRFQWVGANALDVFEQHALQELEQRLQVSRQQYPVLIGNVATAAMNIAARRGNPKVTDEDVQAVWQVSSEELQEMGL